MLWMISKTPTDRESNQLMRSLSGNSSCAGSGNRVGSRCGCLGSKGGTNSTRAPVPSVEGTWTLKCAKQRPGSTISTPAIKYRPYGLKEPYPHTQGQQRQYIIRGSRRRSAHELHGRAAPNMSLGPFRGPSSRDHGVARDHPVPLVLGVLTLLLQQDKTRQEPVPYKKTTTLAN